MPPTLASVELQHNDIGDSGAMALGVRVYALCHQGAAVCVTLNWNCISARVRNCIRARVARAAKRLPDDDQDACICTSDHGVDIGMHDMLSGMDVQG